MLAQWCTRQASVAPVRQQGPELEFRRRQSLERVHAVLVAEELMATPRGCSILAGTVIAVTGH